MSGQPSWTCLSVHEFFNGCNWQGKSLKQLFESISPEPAWLCLTIQEFFCHSNWQGQLLTSNINQTRSSLSLMPVSEFFQFIVWEGNPEIAALPQVAFSEITSSPSQGLKLTDLLNLL